MRIGALSSFSGRGVDVGTVATPSYREVETQLGPIALWGLGGTTLTDAIGSRDLTVTGTPVFGVTDLPSDIDDGAVNFNGAGSASLVHDAGLQLSAFTLSLWFLSNPPDPDALQVAPLIFKSGTEFAAVGKFLIHIMEGTEQVRIRTADGTTNYDLFSQEGSVQSQQKCHLCVRMDSTGLDAFLNGKYLGKITGYTGAWTVNTANLFIGSDPSIPTATLFAHVDEIALYDKVLTDTEVFGLSQTPLAPIANDNTFSVPEAASTVLDVLLNDVFRGAKANATVQIVTQPTGGRDSVSVDGNNDIVYVADTVDADTVTTFTYQIVVGGSISSTATVTTTVLNATAPPTDAPFFGLAIGDDTASPNPSNSKLTASNTAGHSDFFWAERTGTVTHVRSQFRSNGQTGTYSDGDGGIYTIEIRKANMDTKLPLTGAGDLICQVNGYNADVNNTQWPTLQFTTQGQTIKGDPYCLIYRNTHANPGANYVSENRSIRYGNQPGDGGTPPPGGWTPIVLPAGLTGAGQPHKPFPTFTRFPPELTLGRIGPGHWNIRYADGQWVGTGHLGQLATPERHPIIGNSMVRHRFRPWRTHTATGVSICIQRRNASGGSVVLTLESGPASLDTGNGTLIEQVTIAASALFDIGTRDVFDFHNQKVFWNTVNFSQNRTLSAGTIYTIRVSASGGLDGSFNAGYRAEHSNIGGSQAFNNFDDHEAGQTLSWGGWEYSLGLQVSTNGGSTWSFPSGNNRQTCPLLIMCQP